MKGWKSINNKQQTFSNAIKLETASSATTSRLKHHASQTFCSYRPLVNTLHCWTSYQFLYLSAYLSVCLPIHFKIFFHVGVGVIDVKRWAGIQFMRKQEGKKGRRQLAEWFSSWFFGYWLLEGSCRKEIYGRWLALHEQIQKCCKPWLIDWMRGAGDHDFFPYH